MSGIDRRELLTGAAALAAYGRLSEAGARSRVPVPLGGAAAPTITTNLIILAIGQSNMVGGGTGGFVAGDTDSTGRILQWKSGATQANSCGQPLLGWNPSKSNNSACVSPAYTFAQNITQSPGKKTIIYTGAYSATGLCTGSADPYWLPPSGLAYTPVLADLPNLIAAYPDAPILIYWNQGENDGANNVAAALYTSTLETLVSGIRGVSGAANALMIIDSLLPEYIASTFGVSTIDTAHYAFPLAVKNCVWIGASLGFGSGDGVHYTSAGQRINGANAAIMFPLIQGLSNGTPGQPYNVAISGNNVSFNVPASGAHAFYIETQPTGGGAWTGYTRYPSTFFGPRTSITFRVPGVEPSVNVRVSAVSFGGQSSPVVASGVATSGGWWRRTAIVDIDYTDGQVYINGTSYASIAAAVSAGALTASGSGHITQAVTIPAAFSMLANGVNPAVLPTSAAIQCLMSVDDGAAQSASTGNWFVFYLWSISGAVWGGAHISRNNTGNPLGNTTLMNTTTASTASQAVSHACRQGAVNPYKNFAWSAQALNPPQLSATASYLTGLTYVRTGQTVGNTNTWAGTLGRMTLVSTVLLDDELASQT